MSDKFDVIINGSAVGEGTLARRLGPTGNRILILERVDWLKALNWDVKTVFADNRCISPTATRGHSNHKFIILSAAPQKCMARRSTAYARKASGNFANTAESRPPGRSATNDLEPYYTKAEQISQVHGIHGVDPTAPAANSPYSHPPVPNQPRIQQLFDDFKAAGFHLFPAPCGTIFHEQDMANSSCVRGWAVMGCGHTPSRQSPKRRWRLSKAAENECRLSICS